MLFEDTLVADMSDEQPDRTKAFSIIIEINVKPAKHLNFGMLFFFTVESILHKSSKVFNFFIPTPWIKPLHFKLYSKKKDVGLVYVYPNRGSAYLYPVNTNNPRPLLDVSVRILFSGFVKFADFDLENKEQSSRNV